MGGEKSATAVKTPKCRRRSGLLNDALNVKFLTLVSSHYGVRLQRAMAKRAVLYCHKIFALRKR